MPIIVTSTDPAITTPGTPAVGYGLSYLELVNAVLCRLREEEVTTLTQNKYSKMIAKFVNDAKRQVEDAWDWEALSYSLTLTTVAGTSGYTVTGSGLRPKHVTINDTSNRSIVFPVAGSWIQNQQQLTDTTLGHPCYYAWTGDDGTDRKVELFPTPDGTYTLKVNATVPQSALVNATDRIIVPSEPVILGAFARALAERGEDGAMASSEAYALFKASLSDAIALEQARNPEYDCWEAV